MTQGTVRCLLTAALITAALPLGAATKVADEAGFSGFFTLGVSRVDARTNMVATGFGGNADLGDDEIDNLDDAAGSKTSTNVSPGLSLTYTFDNLRSEIFLGSSLEDFVRFDFSTVIGFRQQVDEIGVFELATLNSPLATEVWADPYATGVERDETDREARGFRVSWGAIFDSGFDVRAAQRESDIDDENSGDALVADGMLTPAEQSLLDRNGDISSYDVFYNWDLGRGQLLSVGLTYLEHDLDGDAMSFDGYSLQFNNVTAFTPRFRLGTNILFGQYDHDTVNPVFGEKNDKDLFGLTLTVFYSDLLGFRGWTGVASAAYVEEDNRIDFYDARAQLYNLGVLYRF